MGGLVLSPALPGLPAYVSVALPSTAAGVPLPFAAEIAMRRGLRSSGFGMRTSSTPWLNDAAMASGSTPSGSVSERLKLPNARSMRWKPPSRSLVLGLPLARDRERAVLDLDVHVALREARKVGLQEEVVLDLDEIHRRNPAPPLVRLSEEGVEDAVDLTRERLRLDK